MRVKEIISEGPFDTIKAVAKTVDTAAGQFKAGVKQGYNTTDKLLSPSKWGKDTDTDVQTAKLLEPHVARDVLVRASTGQKMYNDDFKTVASIRAALANKTVTTKQDPAALGLALKTFSQTKVADKNQAAMFATLAKEI